MGRGDERGLTRRDFDAVIRRAAELSSSDSEGGEGALTEGELFRIAGEVGLSEAHVRRALADVRAGSEGGGVLDRVFGPSTVRASRVVVGDPEELATNIDDFLVGSQLLQRVRRGVEIMQYRPAVDWASQLARAASLVSVKYYMASARSVDVRFEQIDDERTMVEFVVDPGMRGEHIGLTAGLGGAGGAITGALAGLSVGALAPLAIAIGAGVVVGGGVWTAVGYGLGRTHQKRLREVREEVEGVLDSLEMGASLEPPPASWRRWVKRNFHGVAKERTSAGDAKKY